MPSLFWTVVLFACKSPATIEDDGDQDDDGFSVPEDCDDTNPRVHPGARDFDNDGLDSNCDGVHGTGPIAFDALEYHVGQLDRATRITPWFTLCDVTGDATVDLVLQTDRVGTSQLQVFAGPLSAGQYTADSGDLVVEIPDGDAIRCGDLDGDGRSDLVVDGLGLGLDVFHVPLAGLASGELDPSATIAGSLEAFDLADFDGDGLADLAVLQRQALWNVPGSRREGDLDLEAIGDVVPVQADAIAQVADLDGDGAPEIAVTYADAVQVFSDLGSVAAGPLHRLEQEGTLVGDFDGDGERDDLVWTTGGFLAVAVDTFADVQADTTQSSFLRLPEMAVTRPQLAGDVDGDGADDLVLIYTTAGGESVVRVVSGALATGGKARVGEATLLEFRGPTVDSIFARHAIRVVTGDVDGDGRLDVVIAFGTPRGPASLDGDVYVWLSST